MQLTMKKARREPTTQTAIKRELLMSDEEEA